MRTAFSAQKLAYRLKFKTKIIVFLFLFSILYLLASSAYFLFSTPATVFAADPPCNVGPTGDQCPASGIIQVQQLMTRLINISVTIAFMALTVWLIWSALKFFITSGGDPKALAQAWQSVTWAFLGLFFMVLAWLVVKLILVVTGADVTSYCLGFPPYCM